MALERLLHHLSNKGAYVIRHLQAEEAQLRSRHLLDACWNGRERPVLCTALVRQARLVRSLGALSRTLAVSAVSVAVVPAIAVPMVVVVSVPIVSVATPVPPLAVPRVFPRWRCGTGALLLRRRIGGGGHGPAARNKKDLCLRQARAFLNRNTPKSVINRTPL